MTIREAKASNYNTVKTPCIVSYIEEYLQKINDLTTKNDLTKKDRTQLKTIAAELETVAKRLDYICNGRY